MRTWGELLFSIEQDLNRGELTDIIRDFALGRVAFWQRHFFFASPLTLVIPCVPFNPVLNNATQARFYDIPRTFLDVERIRIANPVPTLAAPQTEWYDLIEVEDYDDLLDMDSSDPPSPSLPYIWSPFGSQFRIYSVPDQAYPLELTGTGKVLSPVDQAALNPPPAGPPEEDISNFWTDDMGAGLLIRYSTTAQIRALKLRDPDGALIDAEAAKQERQKLASESVLKTSDGIIKGWW